MRKDEVRRNAKTHTLFLAMLLETHEMGAATVDEGAGLRDPDDRTSD